MTYRELLEQSAKQISYYKSIDYRNLGLGCKQGTLAGLDSKTAAAAKAVNDRVINVTLAPETIKSYLKVFGINNMDDLLTRLNLPSLDSQISLEVLKPYIDGSMYFLRLMDNMIKAQKG
jgi:hypothetical protein